MVVAVDGSKDVLLSTTSMGHSLSRRVASLLANTPLRSEDYLFDDESEFCFPNTETLGLEINFANAIFLNFLTHCR
jgi:hypothetical protein